MQSDRLAHRVGWGRRAPSSWEPRSGSAAGTAPDGTPLRHRQSSPPADTPGHNGTHGESTAATHALYDLVRRHALYNFF